MKLKTGLICVGAIGILFVAYRSIFSTNQTEEPAQQTGSNIIVSVPPEKTAMELLASYNRNQTAENQRLLAEKLLRDIEDARARHSFNGANGINPIFG